MRAVRACGWSILAALGVFAVFTFPAAADDQGEIQQAFSKVKGWPAPYNLQEPSAEPALGFSAYFSKIAKQAYGTDPVDVRTESFPALFAIYAFRGIASCYFFAGGKVLVERRTQQGSAEEVVALGQGQGTGFFPWKGGQEEISDIKIESDRATAKYTWRGNSTQNRPLEFSDTIAFQRGSGGWLLEYASYVATMERNAASLGATISELPAMKSKMSGPLYPGFERNETALMGAKSRMVPVLVQACPPVKAEFQKGSNRDELFKNFWTAAGSLMARPIMKWPEQP